MLAGFDTTATTLTNTCFQLARNPDIQEKLYESIVAKMEEYASHDSKLKWIFFLNIVGIVLSEKGEVCHEMVQDLPYLEMVIQEVMRIYSPFLRQLKAQLLPKFVGYNLYF